MSPALNAAFPLEAFADMKAVAEDPGS